MHIKKISIILSSILSISILSACGGDSNESIEALENQAQEQIQEAIPQTVKRDFLNTYKDYSEFDLEQVDDQQLKLLIDETIEEYESLISEQYDVFQSHIDQVRSDIRDNINDFEATKSEAEEEYQEHCQRRNEGNNDACNDIQESIVELQNRINELEVRISNEVGEIEAERRNQLNNTKTRMLNNVGNLLIQGGYEVD